MTDNLPAIPLEESSEPTAKTPASTIETAEAIDIPIQSQYLSRSRTAIPLTKALAEQIADKVKLGLSPSLAGPGCGIAQTTLSRWLSRGAEASVKAEQSELNPIETLYAYLWLAVKDAESLGSEEWVRNLRAGGQQWQRWAWLLERRNREDYGRSQKVEVTGALAIKPDY